MGWVKSIGKSDALRRPLCWLVAQYIRFVWLTGRWQIINGERIARMSHDGQPYIQAFWHARLMMMVKSWPGRGRFHMLISQHRDGQLIARTVAHLGISTVAGSSTRGGAGAIRAILKAIKAGDPVGITPDGPRGPRRRGTAGIANMGRMSGVPVIPVAYSCSSFRRLRSWDRLMIPLPFCRGVILWGEPIHIDKDADMETVRLRIEDALNQITDQADAMFDWPAEDLPPPLTPEDAA